MKIILFWRLVRHRRGWPLPYPLFILLLTLTSTSLLSRTYGCFFPLSPFPMEISRVLNIALSQLFPNNWGYIKVFKMACEDLDFTPIIELFFSFYTIILTKGRWVSLGHAPGNVVFVSHSNHYNYWKDNFTCVRGWKDYLRVLWAGCISLFPISRMNDHMDIIGFDKEFLTLEEARIVRPLGKFEVMDMCTVVKLWLEDGNKLFVYLGKFCIPFIFNL